jgi:hypothetical protein
MPPATRFVAAEAFWNDDQSTEQQVEVIVGLARKLNFRPKSIQALPVERRARQLAQILDVSETVAARALIALHLRAQRPMMAAFLDALGIPHDNGIITAESVPAPAADRLEKAVAALRAAFPADDVTLYLRTLAAVDGDTWGGLDTIAGVSA